jgi:cell wall-associated NlpC family hydrolase
MSKRARPAGGARRVARPAAWSVVACSALCLLVAAPAQADPVGPGGVPDPGAPPVASGPLDPGTGRTPATSTAAPVAGPLGSQILTQSAEVEALGERLTRLNQELTAAQQATRSTYQAWVDASSQAAQARQRADNAAAQAYKNATRLGPYSGYANDLHQLGELAPGFEDSTGTGTGGNQTAAQDATKATQLEQSAYAGYQATLANEQRLADQQAKLSADHAQKSSALADLRSRNSGEVARAEAAQQAIDSGLASQFGPGTQVNGRSPSPIALAAVRAALSRLGKPYVWGAEGPDAFDCSGLVYWSYHQAGYTGPLPRVAADQYHATKPVPVSQLLPGDLLFFSTTSRTDWTAISHVGIYLGGGKMVEAPTTGDVVKIATVWWSAFFGATRVVDAVPAPSPSPTPTHSPSPSHTPPSSAPPSSTPPSSAPPSSAPPSSAPPSSTPSSAPPSNPPSTQPSPTPAPPPVGSSASSSASASTASSGSPTGTP